MYALRAYKLALEHFFETEAPVRTRFFRIKSLQYTVTLPKCATPQVCNTLQHTETHCNTVTQHMVSFVLAFCVNQRLGIASGLRICFPKNRGGKKICLIADEQQSWATIYMCVRICT